jgi:hypothetical protein
MARRSPHPSLAIYLSDLRRQTFWHQTGRSGDQRQLVGKKNQPAGNDGLAVMSITGRGVRGFNWDQGSTSSSLWKTTTA